MVNIMPLVIFFGIWILGLIIFYRGYKSPLGKKYSDNELLLPRPKQVVEKVPRHYNFFYWIGIIFLIVSFSFIMIIFSFATSFFQKLFFTTNESILITPDTAFVASIFPSIFFGSLFGYFLYIIFYQFFPKLNQYQALKSRINQNTMGLGKKERNKIWEDALHKVDTAKLAKAEWRGFFIFGLICWFIAMPLYFLAIDHYYKITSDSLIINRYLSLIEKQYVWSDIKFVKAYATLSKSDQGGISLHPKIEVTTSDGTEIDFWGGASVKYPPSDELINILQKLHIAGVKFEVQPLTDDQKSALLNYNQKAQENVNAVFRYLESLK